MSWEARRKKGTEFKPTKNTFQERGTSWSPPFLPRERPRVAGTENSNTLLSEKHFVLSPVIFNKSRLSCRYSVSLTISQYAISALQNATWQIVATTFLRNNHSTLCNLQIACSAKCGQDQICLARKNTISPRHQKNENSYSSTQGLLEILNLSVGFI